ncbi:MAG: glycosyltransferase family 2 protein [Pyrinomonadaceae bacterium]|nr:glycosyltransferase family 2 protein [Sphingobacteriaceae bacterium]
MKINSDISVAMATYNGVDYLEGQIKSILGQDLQPFEIIIVDDASSDATTELIEKYQQNNSNIKLITNRQNLGPVLSFKKAVSACKGKYIALCDQDDIWETNKLRVSLEQLKKIEDDNLPSMVYTDLKVIDKDGILINSSFWKQHRFNPLKINLYNLLFGNVITGCTILFNQSMAKELKLMPADVLMHDHWMALIAYGFGRVKALDIPTVNYRTHKESVTSKEMVNLFKRMRMIFNTLFDSNNHYLNGHIVQAEKFYMAYSKRLSVHHRTKIEKFIDLKRSTSFVRKIYSGFNRIVG